MAITQVGTATTGFSANTGAFSITKPTGVASGDVLIVFGTSNAGAWDTLPSGFVQFQVSNDANTVNSFRGYGWYKVCGGSEPASYSFGSTTALGVGAPMVAVMTAWNGVSNTTPIDDSATTEGGAAAEPANPTISITQTATGRLIFARSARDTAALPTFSTATAGWTETGEINAFSGGSTRYGIAAYNQTSDTGAGARSEPAVTNTSTETDNVYILAALLAAPIATNAPATGATVALTANDASVVSTASAGGATPTVTAYNATVETGVAALAGVANRSYDVILAGSGNLITNGDFETNTTGWDVNSSAWANSGAVLTQSVSDSVRGVACANVTYDNTLNQRGINWRSLPFIPNTPYTATVWIKVISGRPIRLRVRDWNAGVAVLTSSSLTVTTGQWEALTLSFTSGANAADHVNNVASIVTDTTVGTGQFLVDDVQFFATPVDSFPTYNASVWTIGLPASSLTAWDATVGIGTTAAEATLTRSASSVTGYYGAGAARTWRIPAEDRTWRIEADDRTWRIPSSD